MTCSSQKVTHRKRLNVTRIVDNIFVSTLLAHISWNSTVFTAKRACFCSFPHHPLSPFSLRFSSGTWDCFLQSIRRTASILYVWMLPFFLSLFSAAKIKAAMTFPLMSRLGAKCVYWSTVMDAEEHKRRAAIQSDLIETAQKYRGDISPQLHTCLETQHCLSSQPINQATAAQFSMICFGKANQSKLRGGTYVGLYYLFFFFFFTSSATSSQCSLSTAIFHCLWFCIVSFEHNRHTAFVNFHQRISG